jgi:hypothetical protein
VKKEYSALSFTVQKASKNLEGLHKGEPTKARRDEFHEVSNRDAQNNDCDNIDSGESIDTKDQQLQNIIFL